MSDKPLRDWTVGSYKQDGRPVSSLETKQADKQMPTASCGMSGTENKDGSGDKSRRNK